MLPAELRQPGVVGLDRLTERRLKGDRRPKKNNVSTAYLRGIEKFSKQNL